MSGTAAQVTAALQGLVFTPGVGVAPDTQSISVLTLTDQSSAGPSASDGATSVTNVDPAVAPVIAGTHASSTSLEASVTPFSDVTIGDPNAGATDTLTIQLSNGGSGGTLTGNGLGGGQNGTYVLTTGAARDVQNQLQALVFTPVPGAPGHPVHDLFHAHRPEQRRPQRQRWRDERGPMSIPRWRPRLRGLMPVRPPWRRRSRRSRASRSATPNAGATDTLTIQLSDDGIGRPR